MTGSDGPTGAAADRAERIAAWLQAAERALGPLAPPGVSGPDALRTRSGEEFLRAIGRGELPSVPIGRTLDFVPIEVEPGRVVFQGTPQLAHYNPIGSVHGGWVATLLDSAVGCAVHSTLPAGKGYTTLELKINYVRAVTVDSGPLRAEGKIITAGARIGTAEGRLTDASGRLYAFATTTCLVFDL